MSPVMEVVYNPALIALSVAVAIFASYVALNLAYSLTHATGQAKAVWLAAGSLAMGVGIWSMHFIGMLAFEMPGMEMAYDISLMLVSIVVAVLGSALGLFIISRPVVTTRALLGGGAAMALAIAGMHYIGMYSMRMAAHIEWNYLLVFLSVVIALVASLAALTILSRLRNNPDRFSVLAIPSALMGFAISGMHYTGMLAATFIHNENLQITESDLLVSSGLTLATLSTSVLILGLALAGSIGHRVMSRRQKYSDEILGRSEESYRVLVEAIKDYGIVMLDPNGYITMWNSGAETITGYAAPEIIGKHVSALYSTGDAVTDMAENELAAAEKMGRYEGEAVRRRKDGRLYWANIVTHPLVVDGKLMGFSKVIRDITKARNLNEEMERRVRERTLALQQREEQLRSVTNAIPILVAQFDRFERVMFANDSFCDWFHRTQGQIAGMHLREVIGEERYAASSPYVERALAGETLSYERESESGSRRAHLRVTFVPELGADGVRGFIVVAADVSSYKSIEAELKQAKRDAEAANQAKSAFLANMSHEIRTPLGAVIGFSDLMLNGELSPAERQNTIEIIKRNGQLLSAIINDILDLSKVEAGKLETERSELQLREVLNEIARFLNLEASGKGIKFSVATEGPVPETVKTDPVRLRQILFNIVGNAIKFTNKGFISLTVRLCETDTGRMEFVVRDSGTGIAPEQAARLFSPFTQADFTTTRKFGGTGLGLALSKKLANALGGDVILAGSRWGQGSTFVISIEHGQPLEDIFRAGRPISEPTAGPSSPLPSLDGLHVLIVDDSPDNITLIQSILKIAGAKVETAETGREGIEKALSGHFDAVLMDLQMPEMDGFEATGELRRRGYKAPVIALTAHAMKEDRLRCLQNGFDEHLTKPIDRRGLIQMLAGLHQSHPVNPIVGV